MQLKQCQCIYIIIIILLLSINFDFKNLVFILVIDVIYNCLLSFLRNEIYCSIEKKF